MPPPSIEQAAAMDPSMQRQPAQDSQPYWDVLWEQRRSFLCFGWHKPCFTPRWTDSHGQSLVKAPRRPRTRQYRKELRGEETGASGPDSEWCIVVDQHTDEKGWSYGGSTFQELFRQRLSLRSRPKRTDYVKRRKWVHQSQVPIIRKEGLRGSIKALRPKEIYDTKAAAKKNLDEAKAAIWALIDELDKSMRIKDFYISLLDPVALNRVAVKHLKAMKHLQRETLQQPRIVLLPEERWPPPSDRDPANWSEIPQPRHTSEIHPGHHMGHKLVDGVQDTTHKLIDFAQNATDEVGKRAATFIHGARRLLTAGSIVRHMREGSHTSKPHTTTLDPAMTSPVGGRPASGLQRPGSEPLPALWHLPTPQATSAASVANGSMPGGQKEAGRIGARCQRGGIGPALGQNAGTAPAGAAPVTAQGGKPTPPGGAVDAAKAARASTVGTADTASQREPAIASHGLESSPGRAAGTGAQTVWNLSDETPCHEAGSGMRGGAATGMQVRPVSGGGDGASMHAPVAPTFSGAGTVAAAEAVPQGGRTAVTSPVGSAAEFAVAHADSSPSTLSVISPDASFQVDAQAVLPPLQPLPPALQPAALSESKQVDAVGMGAYGSQPGLKPPSDTGLCITASDKPGSPIPVVDIYARGSDDGLGPPGASPNRRAMGAAKCEDPLCSSSPAAHIFSATAAQGQAAIPAAAAECRTPSRWRAAASKHMPRQRGGSSLDSPPENPPQQPENPPASVPRRQLRNNSSLRQTQQSSLISKVLPFGRFRRDSRADAAPWEFQLSLPELRCAYVHACAIYGDFDIYVGGAPAQTFTRAVEKFTGVPEKDVIFSLWKSEVFKPGHYVLIDRAMGKIVISIRGTFESADAISDVVARPVSHTFSPLFKGCVHIGMLKAAQFVVSSVWRTVEHALLLAPDYPILVTGHSMGGGVAGLVALLLRCDQRLSAQVCSKVRAVCLAPAAVMDLELTSNCRGFVASIMLGSDVVPRIGLHTFAKFVQEVAKASPLNYAKKRVGGTVRWCANLLIKKKLVQLNEGQDAGNQHDIPIPPDDEDGQEPSAGSQPSQGASAVQDRPAESTGEDQGPRPDGLNGSQQAGCGRSGEVQQPGDALHKGLKHADARPQETADVQREHGPHAAPEQQQVLAQEEGRASGGKAGAQGSKGKRKQPPAKPRELTKQERQDLLRELYPPGVLLWVIPDEENSFEIAEGGKLVPSKPSVHAGDPGTVELALEGLSEPGGQHLSREDGQKAGENVPDAFSNILMSELQPQETSNSNYDPQDKESGGTRCSCFSAGSARKDSSPVGEKVPRFEVRQVEPHVACKEILFFKKALMDHMPKVYFHDLQCLVKQQQVLIDEQLKGRAGSWSTQQPSEQMSVRGRHEQGGAPESGNTFRQQFWKPFGRSSSR